MADAVRYAHIQHGAKSLDNGGSMFKPVSFKGLLHHSVYRAYSLLLGSKTGTWMLFLKERWRGESLLKSYVCLVHSFWPMANVNPYVCKRHALQQFPATKNAGGNELPICSQKQKKLHVSWYCQQTPKAFHVQHKYCINCNLIPYLVRSNVRWCWRKIKVEHRTMLWCDSCREETILRPRRRWNNNI